MRPSIVRPHAPRIPACQSCPGPYLEVLEDRLLLAAPEFIGPWGVLPDRFIIKTINISHDSGLPSEGIEQNRQALTIPINGSDADGDPLTITAVGSANLDVYVSQANTTFALLNFTESDGTPIGSILVQLFGDQDPLTDDLSPSAVERFITLATRYIDPDGNILDPDAEHPAFYTDVPVHRVIPEFMIQTGDPVNCDGSGGSPLDPYVGEFPEALGFAGPGVLALANAGPGTNNSQFFITDAPAMHLRRTTGDGFLDTPDQEHPIFGQVITGWDVLQDVINRRRKVDAEGHETDAPVDPPLLASVEIVPQTRAGSVHVVAGPGFSVDETITVTLSDGTGQSTDWEITVQSAEPAPPTVAPAMSLDLESSDNDIIFFTSSYDGPFAGSYAIWMFHNYHGTGGMLLEQSQLDAGTHLARLTPSPEYNGQPFTVTMLATLTNFGNMTPVAVRSAVRYGERPTIDQLVFPPTPMAGESVAIPLAISDSVPTTYTVTAETTAAGVTASVDPTTHVLTVSLSTSVTAPTVDVVVRAVEAEHDQWFTPSTKTISVPVLQYRLGALEDIVDAAPGQTREVPLPVEVPQDPSAPRTPLFQFSHTYAGPGAAALSGDSTFAGDAGTGYRLNLALPVEYDGTGFLVTVTVSLEEFPELSALQSTFYVRYETRPVISPVAPLFLAAGQTVTADFSAVDDSGAMTELYVWAEAVDQAGLPLPGAIATVAPAGQPNRYRLTLTAPADYHGVFQVKLLAVEAALRDLHASLAPAERAVHAITMGFVPIEPHQVVHRNGYGLTIGLDGFSGVEGPLTYTATTDRPDDLDLRIAEANTRYAELHFANADGTPVGSVLVQLFDDRSPTAVERFVTLATKAVVDGEAVDLDAEHPNPYYYNVPISGLFAGRWLQTGMPADAGEGSGLGEFTNDPGPGLFESGNLTFSGPGVLAFMRTNETLPFTGDDGFIMTVAPLEARNTHDAIFAQVVSGMDTLWRLMLNGADGDNVVLDPQPVLTGVTVIEPASPRGPEMAQNATLTMTPRASGLSGDAGVTITATDQQDHSWSQTITVHIINQFALHIATVSRAPSPAVATGRQTDFTVNIARSGRAVNGVTFESWHDYDGPGQVAFSFSPTARPDTFILHVIVPPEYDGQSFRALISPRAADMNIQLSTVRVIDVSFGSRPEVTVPDATIGSLEEFSAEVTMTIADDADDFTFSQPQVDPPVAEAVIAGTEDPRVFTVTVTLPPDSAFTGVIAVSFTVLESRYAGFANVEPTAASFVVSTFGGNIVGTLFEAPTNGRGLAIGVDGVDRAGTGLSYFAGSEDDRLHFSWQLGGQAGRDRFAKLTFVSANLVDEDGDGIREKTVEGGLIGEIYVLLYDDIAGAAVRRFVELSTMALVESQDEDVPSELVQPDEEHPDPYYTDVNVHRLIPGFMLQSGDAVKGDGTGSTGLEGFDVGFMQTLAYRELSFAGPGVLAMANRGGDPATSDAQLFITQQPFTFGDPTYVILGQMIGGWETYERVMFRTRDTSNNDRPFVMPRLKSVEIIDGADNVSDAVLMVRADQDFTGPAEVQITIRDSLGHELVKTINVVPGSAIDPMDAPAPILQDGLPTENSIGNKDVDDPDARDFALEFQHVHPADRAVEVRTAHDYAGQGQVQIQVSPRSSANQPGGQVLVTYDLNVTLPEEYDGTPVTIWAWVQPEHAGNAEADLAMFHISTLGGRPELGDGVTLVDAQGNPLVDDQGDPLVAATGNEVWFKLPITDDQDADLHTTVEVRVDGQTAYVPVDADGEIFRLSLSDELYPDGFYGVVTFVVTAVEAADVDTRVLTPVDKVYKLLIAPQRPAPDQVAPPLWHGDADNANVVLATDNYLIVGTLDQGLRVYDAADPAGAPLDEYEWPGNQPAIHDLELVRYGSGDSARDVLFVATDTWGLVSFRLNAPTSEGILEPLDAYAGIYAYDVAIETRTVYAAGGLVTHVAYVGTIGQGLVTLDVSNPALLGRDPARPTLVSARRPLDMVTVLFPTFETRMKYQNYPQASQLFPLSLGWVTSVAVQNGVVLVSDSGYVFQNGQLVGTSLLGGYLGVLDARRPDAVTKIREYRMYEPVWDAARDGTTLAVLTRGGLRVYYAPSLAYLRLRGILRRTYTHPAVEAGFPPEPVEMPAVALEGNTAIVGYPEGFDIINIQDPARMTLRQSFLTPWTYTDQSGQARPNPYWFGRVPVFSAAHEAWMLPNGYAGLHALDATILNRFIRIPLRYTHVDENGTPVTITIVGGGSLQLTLADTFDERMERLEVFDPTPATRVSIVTSAGRTTTIGGIAVHGSLAGLIARTTVLDGGMDVDMDGQPDVDALGRQLVLDVEGTVRQIMLNNVGSDQRQEKSIRIGGTATSLPAIIILGAVRDLRIDSGLPIVVLTAVNWLDEQAEVPDAIVEEDDAIVAPALSRLIITGRPGQRGDFQADVTLGDAAPMLAAAIVTGIISESEWDVGPVGLLLAGQWASGRMSASAVNSIITRAGVGPGAPTGGFAAELTIDGAIRYACIAGTVTGPWRAGAIGALVVRGDADAWTALLDQPPTAYAAQRTLGILSVLGAIRDSRILAAGRVGAVLAGAMIDSDIYAGYVPARTRQQGDVAGLPSVEQLTDPDLFDALGTVARLTIRGLLESGQRVDSFVNSNIAAAGLGVIHLAYGDLTNGGVKFGLAADTLTRLSYLSTDLRYVWPNRAEPDAPRELGDLVTRLV